MGGNPNPEWPVDANVKIVKVEDNKLTIEFVGTDELKAAWFKDELGNVFRVSLDRASIERNRKPESS